MATGMVLVIVTRNIDLSVGSVLGVTGMIIGVTQAEVLPALIGYDHGATWLIALAVGIVAGALIGALQGFVIAYLAVAGLYRHSGRPARLARRGLAGHFRAHGWRPWTATFRSWAAVRKVRSEDR